MDQRRTTAPLDPNDLANALQQVRRLATYTSLTFLMSDGRSLYAYREWGAGKLARGERQSERPRYYTLHMGRLPRARGVVFCSQPISLLSVRWRPLKNRELIILGPPHQSIL